MTHQQLGWSRDHDFLHERTWKREETWLTRRLREVDEPVDSQTVDQLVAVTKALNLSETV